MAVLEGCASPKVLALHVPRCLVYNWAGSQHLLSCIVSLVAGWLSHLLASLPVRTRAQLPTLCSLCHFRCFCLTHIYMEVCRLCPIRGGLRYLLVTQTLMFSSPNLCHSSPLTPARWLCPPERSVPWSPCQQRHPLHPITSVPCVSHPRPLGSHSQSPHQLSKADQPHRAD